jgi:hypothetical protein
VESPVEPPISSRDCAPQPAASAQMNSADAGSSRDDACCGRPRASWLQPAQMSAIASRSFAPHGSLSGLR